MTNQHGTSFSGRRQNARPVFEHGYGYREPAAKDKDLLGIPWMVAFALRDDGWYLRSDIIWSKPNPMPESVLDRPTSSHEHIFLLTKNSRYYYDADAIREPHLWSHVGATRLGERSKNGGSPGNPVEGKGNSTGSFRAFAEGGRNKRNVWAVATEPYPEAHFATFPTKLIEPCILAGSARGDTVLDPFAGSGTVGVVCAWTSREFVGIELNADYCEMAEQRIEFEGRGGGKLRPPPEQIDGQIAMELDD
jgi:site-specific DNA-methyltransferase (adenine-specific)